MLRRSVGLLVVGLGMGHGPLAAQAQPAPPAGSAPVVEPALDPVPDASVDPVADASVDPLDTGWAPPPHVLPAEPAPSQVEPANPAAAPAAAAAGFRWRPFGYLRVQGALVQDDPNVAFVGRDDGFALQNARLGVRGQLAGRAGFEVSVDGAVDEREVNAPNGELRFGLRDALVELQLASSVAARIGRFEIWFDPDGRDGDPRRPFVDRALESRGVRATEGWETRGLPPGRSIGVAVRWAPLDGAAPALDPPPDGAAAALDPRRGGAEPVLQVELAAQNGADEFASGNDNDALALSVAVRATATVGWLQVAGRYNPRTEGALPFRQDETDLQASIGAGTALGPVRLAAGAALVSTRFETTGGSSQRGWGAHGQALVRLPLAQPLEVGYRFAILDPSSLVLTDRLMEHTLGVVLGLPRWRSRVLLNATHAVEQASRELANDRLEALLEVVL